jgi:hypothetical protein
LILSIEHWGGHVSRGIDLAAAVSAFGAATKRKLASRAASGAPEDHFGDRATKTKPVRALLIAVPNINTRCNPSLTVQSTCRDNISRLHDS